VQESSPHVYTLQFVAMCCSVKNMLQCVAVCCSAMQCVTVMWARSFCEWVKSTHMSASCLHT